MGPTPVYGARAEKPLQNADFAMKQTNICRLSGDIMREMGFHIGFLVYYAIVHNVQIKKKE